MPAGIPPVANSAASVIETPPSPLPMSIAMYFDSAYVGTGEDDTLPSTTALPFLSVIHDEKSTSTDWLLVVALANPSSPMMKFLSGMLPALHGAPAFIMPG